MGTIDVPADVYDALSVPEDERDDVLRQELAVHCIERTSSHSGRRESLQGSHTAISRHFLATAA